MSYSLQIGLRYLRSKKRQTVSVITVIAITAVALGVGALLAVLSITSGFQQDFRDKVLGVNAHVLILKYGLDFDEYRDVIARAEKMPEVVGANPFLINEMMIAHDDELSGVLVKGVDPKRMPEVLDLPEQIIAGDVGGLRKEGSSPPVSQDELDPASPDDDLDAMLHDLVDGDEPGGAGTAGDPDAGAGSVDAGIGGAEDVDAQTEEALRDRIAEGEGRQPLFESEREASQLLGPERTKLPEPPDAGELAEGPPPGSPGELPNLDVPSPEEVEQALAGMDDGSLEMPDDEGEEQLLEEGEDRGEDERPTADLPGVVVGKTLADNIGVEVGDRVKVVSPLTGVDVSMFKPDARTPRSRDYQVIAVFEAGFQEYDSRLVYVDLYEAQRFYDNGDSVTGVELRLRDLESSGAVAEQLERELGGPFHTMDWAELNHNLFTALQIQKIMLSIVISSIIVVAAFVVVATLIMVVLEKKREIAILKAMGATDLSVLGIFVVQGAVIGLVGTLIGLALGGGVVAYLKAYEFPLDPKVYLIDHLPVVVSPWEFLVTVLVAFGICLTATLIPSWWAARLLPADGVRYE
ncbi:MAG: FtsX-like permease family protein [Polyangiales bacterium]